MKERFIVKVLKKTEILPGVNSTSQAIREEVNQIYEQEFDSFDIGEFAVSLNKKKDPEKKDGQVKDQESIKV